MTYGNIKRGRPKGKGGTNMDIKNNLNDKQGAISRIIGESARLRKNTPVKSNEELEERLDEYFNFCQEKGQIPTVEDMALALGVTRQSLHNWEHGINANPERSRLIQQAKETLAAIDAKLVSEGKIPQVTYIFRAKNYFGMKDQQDFILTPNQNPLGETASIEELQKKYLEKTYGISDNYPLLEESNDSGENYEK